MFTMGRHFCNAALSNIAFRLFCCDFLSNDTFSSFYILYCPLLLYRRLFSFSSNNTNLFYFARILDRESPTVTIIWRKQKHIQLDT